MEKNIIMEELKNLIAGSEDWLMEQILNYAKLHDYTKYTSTLKEAWRISIEGLSNALCTAIDSGMDVELNPDETFSKDPIAEFGIIEAKKHRDRGISYSMFIGLFKYYAQSYRDLILKQKFSAETSEKYINYTSKVFDRIEIAFSSEWINLRGEDKLDELKDANRKMTNEKNMYLTVVESLANPVFLLNSEKSVTYINKSASELLNLSVTPGGFYYHRESSGIALPQWLKEHTDNFFLRQLKDLDFDISCSYKGQMRFFQGRISLMEDISDKFSGAVLILNDITELREAGDKIRNLLTEKEIILKEVHHRIKNNLNTIKMLLFLQADAMADSPAASILQDAENRVDSMMILYDKLYRSDNFNEISVKNYIPSLIDEIMSNFPGGSRIRIVKNIDDFILDVKKFRLSRS